MKSAIVFVTLLAGITASVIVIPQFEPENVIVVPQDESKIDIDSRNARFVDDLVSRLVDEVRVQIREAGLDPWILERTDGSVALPIPTLLSLEGYLQNVRLTGLSNIVINHINFVIFFFTGTLDLDIALPQISLSFGDAGYDVTILGHNFVGRTSSSINIVDARIYGNAVVSVAGAVVGSPVRSLDLSFDLGDLRYNGVLILQGADYGPLVNQFLSVNLLGAIRDVRAEINELVEMIAWTILDAVLG